jgi:hypothetical protein
MMSTLTPPATKKFSDDSLESQAYKIAENLKEYLPVLNDRNRLGFALYLYKKGEGDKPEILVKSLKLSVEKISLEGLTDKIKNELEKIK